MPTVSFKVSDAEAVRRRCRAAKGRSHSEYLRASRVAPAAEDPAGLPDEDR